MAKRKTAAAWRAFLGALARTGNVRVAAAAAGMDPGTAHDRRIRNAGFAVKWAAALAGAKSRPSPRPSPRNGRGSPELVLRRTKRGDKLVAAAEGRWCRRVEGLFFAELGRTGYVRSAAAAAGISTNALYYRRDKYPEFAERWHAVEAAAAQRLPGLLHAAGIASLDPEIVDKGLPRVNVDQAIAIARLKCGESGGGASDRGSRNLYRPKRATEEELTEALLKQLAALDKRLRRERVGAGWTETDGGVLIPPGWVRAVPDGEGGGGEGGG